MADDSPFLSRWARRKALVRQGVAPPEPVLQAPANQPIPATTAPAPPAAPAESGARPAGSPTAESTAADAPPPSLADVEQMGLDGDYTRFMAREVDPGVKNAALKKLFTDPHFNVMDGLDIYIDDYGKPDPLPPGMLRRMAQSSFLGLFDDEPKAEADTATATATAPEAPQPVEAPDTIPADPLPAHASTDEDPDLRLQSNDAAGPAGAEAGAAEDPGRQH